MLTQLKDKNFLSKSEIEKCLNFKFLKKNILVTFHPETLNKESTKKNFMSLLNALKKFKNTNIIFTMPNHDIILLTAL